jgi:hypothetical protein
VAPVYVAAFALVSAAAVSLGFGMLSGRGSRLIIVALVSSLGGLLLLGLGVVRSSGARPS